MKTWGFRVTLRAQWTGTAIAFAVGVIDREITLVVLGLRVGFGVRCGG